MGARVLAIREGRFKLIIDFEHGRDFLFDLDVDPEEATPLADDIHRPVRRRLLNIAREHLLQSTRPDEKSRLQAQLRELQLELGHPATTSLPVAS